MNLLRNTLITAIATAGIASAQNLDWEKTVGNSDAKATIEFKTAIIQNSDPFLAKRYFARGFFKATGKVLNHSFTFIDVGARADSHDGGMTLQGYYQPNESESVWFYIAGQQLHTTGSSSYSQTVSIPIAQVNRNVAVGPFTIKVKAGTGITVGVDMDATASNQNVEIGAGPLAGIDVDASGSISAGGLGSLTVTSNVGLAETDCDVTAKSRTHFKGSTLDLEGHALTVKIKLKVKAIGSLVNHTETLVNKSYGSWNKTFNL